MATTSNNTNIEGTGNLGAQVGQNYGTISISYQSNFNSSACHQIFRLAKETSGRTYEWYKNRIADRLPNTCRWFLSHPNYLSWKASSQGPLLVSADPGCGKSVIAKHVVEHELVGTVCYFFFKAQDQNTAQQAVCALLHQLFTQRGLLLRHAQSEFDMNGPKLVTNIDLLWNIFEKAVRDPEAGMVTIVLDALDECDPSDLKDLTRVLKQQVQNSSGQVQLKVLFITRPYLNIVSEFWELVEDFPQIQIPGEKYSQQISEEVDYVIRYRVKQIARKFKLDDRLKQTLENRLLQTHNRTYLWVHLIFEHLASGFRKTEKDLRGTIDMLPNNINQAYESILTKSTDAEKAHHAFCIILAARRPLTLEELNVAVNIKVGPRRMNSIAELNLEATDHFLDTLRGWCGLLITEFKGNIYFLHETAREFLLHKSSAPSLESAIWQGSISGPLSQAYLVEICLTYLNCSEFDHLIDEQQELDEQELDEQGVTYMPFSEYDEILPDIDDHPYRKVPLFEYAALEWPEHYLAADATVTVETAKLAWWCCRPYELIPPVWFWLYWEDNFIKDTPFGFTALTVVSLLGLHNLVKLGATKQNCNSPARFGKSPLFYAAEHGHGGVVAELLKAGADIDIKDWNGDTALLQAAKEGNYDMAEILLNFGANMHLKDRRNETPLHAALKSGSDDIVTLLLDRDAAVTYRNRKGKTALHYAASQGSQEAATLLLDRGAAHSARDFRGRTPLHRAAMRNHVNVASILVDRGADVNARDKRGETILDYAVLWEASIMASWLTDRGAKRMGRTYCQ